MNKEDTKLEINIADFFSKKICLPKFIMDIKNGDSNNEN